MNSNKLQELTYFRTTKTECIFITRFCSKQNFVVGRLCYLPSSKGHLQFKHTKYRKVNINEKLLRQYECISYFPDDNVYWIPVEDILDIIYPIFNSSWSKSIDLFAVKYLQEIHEIVTSNGGEIGFIGSILFRNTINAIDDLDLIITGRNAWFSVEKFIKDCLKKNKIKILDWRKYKKDLYRKQVFQLSDKEMDRIRRKQWWRHLCLGKILFSLSYLNTESKKDVDFNFMEEKTCIDVTFLRENLYPTSAPYRYRILKDRESDIKGVATLGWFFKQGLAGLYAQIKGEIVKIDKEKWVLFANPNELVLKRNK